MVCFFHIITNGIPQRWSLISQTIKTFHNFFHVAAEKFLESVEGSPNYTVVLLALVKEDSADMILRVAAAITFKNTVKRNWRIVSFDVFEVH